MQAPSPKQPSPSAPLSYLPPISHASADASQASHLDDLLMPTQQHAHRRTAALILRTGPAGHLREARALGGEIRAAHAGPAR
jgi:hypothetical protein